LIDKAVAANTTPRKRRDWFLILGGAFLGFVLFMAILGPAIRSAQLNDGSRTFDSVSTSVGRPYQAISWKYLLGTDELGRDMFARLAQGARFSLTVAVVVETISIVVGVIVGVTGVYSPRYVSTPLMRLTDSMFAFPDILLAILIIGIIGPGFLPVIVALSITSWPSIARLVLTQTATLKDREYVIAAKAVGATTLYQVTRHILPQLVGILLAVGIVDMAGTILAESTLSFLGIGIQAPNPSWGSMINNFRQDMNSHPGALVPACAVLSLTIFALNFVGDGLRAYFDPKNT
jgi:ABC-type dipeptide/oligopeptide/nickel transport system permease subunit